MAVSIWLIFFRRVELGKSKEAVVKANGIIPYHDLLISKRVGSWLIKEVR
jgi:hypothetical protein